MIREARLMMVLAVGLLCLGVSGILQGAPAVSSFSPTRGVPGTQVTVQGAGFNTASKVQFGDAAADFTATADNRLVAIVPPNAITGRIRVTNPTGTGLSAAEFMAAPRVTGFDPLRSASNTFVTIDGFNFMGTTAVEFAGKGAVFTVTAATQIRAAVPVGATNGPIRVTTPAGVGISEQEFVVTGPAPIIDYFEPPIGLPGTEVFIHGANFTNVTAVRFNNVNATSFATPAHTQLRAIVPNGATTGRIVVTTPGGSTTNDVDFIVSGRPYVRSFNPQVGRDGFTQVTIEGLNFAGVTGVGFNGRPVTGIATPAQNHLLVTVPAGATTGLITVTNASGSGASSANFTITLAPLIEYFDPVQGAPGTPVTVGGINLSNGFTVLKFGGVQAPFTVTGQNGTQIRATVPTGAKSGPLTMTNAHGTFVTVESFFVTGSAPFVTELAPAHGPRGTEVIITGGNFTSPATVRFNGVVDSTAAVTALTQIRATVPAGALSGPVTVTTASGTSTNGPTFHVPPRITSITPSEGVVGTPVVLAGTNFTSATSLFFNGTPADFQVMSSNQIATIVPGGAGTGPVTIATPGGVFTSASNFKVLPEILTFEPALGPAGTVVTVRGTTFTNVNSVSFNNSTASFTLISRDELHATVPAAATTGPIRVTTADGTAVSSTSFLVTRSSDLGLMKQVTPATVQPGETLVFTLVATNMGDSVVTGVAISDQLPVGLQFLEASVDQGTVNHANGLVSAQVGAFTNGTAVTMSISALATEMGVFTNRASIVAVEADPVPGNNQGSARFVVVADAARRLNISRGNDTNVVVRWPVSPVPMILESIAPMSTAGSWSPVPGVPVVVQGNHVVTNNVAGELYYRLRVP